MVSTLHKDHRLGFSSFHVLFVDINNGEILDCVKFYVMTISVGSIEFCVGDWFGVYIVADFRLIELHPVAQSTGGNRNPISTEKGKHQHGRKNIAKLVDMTTG